MVETRDHGFTIVGTSEESTPEFALANLDQLSMQEGSGPIWLLRTDSTGEMVWDNYLGNEGDKSTFLTTVEDGGYLITGRTNDGDIFLRQYVNVVKNGEMAAVWLKAEKEATLKKVYVERDRIRLQPANRQMRPIYAVPGNVEIQGKVIAVIRQVA